MWYKKAWRRHLCDMHIDDWSPEFLSQFDPKVYVENLKRAKVQSAMLYFQSHVGLCHFPTKVGKMHHAFQGKEDMMKQVVDLCHEAGIAVIGYYSVLYNNDKNRFMAPKVITDNEDYTEEWICYKCKEVSAKRLTIQPGKTVTIKDAAAYGFILLQGKGKFGVWEIETPTLIRYGELTNDEFFVTEKAAKEGIVVTNTSATEPIVMLKHFAENPELIVEE